MELIILGHIIGDFYVQTDRIAEKKKSSMIYMLIHCLIYTIFVGLCFYIVNRDILSTIIASSLIFVCHLIIDLSKRYGDRKLSQYEYIVFLADQAMHIIVITIVFFLFKDNIYVYLDEYSKISNIDISACIMIASAFFICWKPAAIFVSLVFKLIPNTVEKADETKKNESAKLKENAKELKAAEMTGKSESSVESVRIGRWIGILEREIILILGLLGQYGAIGFVLTAKSLARFKQLEDKAFAEKYLVGTLLSALIAILCIVYTTYK